MTVMRRLAARPDRGGVGPSALTSSKAESRHQTSPALWLFQRSGRSKLHGYELCKAVNIRPIAKAVAA